jgi:TetR/AcrR family transcriptional regulator, regulator of cefoperazone and chloramphenicol sensitivity
MANRLQTKSRRRYSSPIRQAQAGATRRAILTAARKVFSASGYAVATIDSVASEAQVSVPTVYAVFGSKAALLSAVVADAGSDGDIRRLADRALNVADPRRRLAHAARVVRTIMEREGAILRLIDEAGTASPELKAASRQAHSQQRNALGRVLQPLDEGGAIRRGLDLDEAVATFSALASPECYRLLVDEVGWSGARWERWLAESAARLLLRPG